MRKFVVCIALSAACGGPPPPERGAIDVEAVERELMEADRAFARATAARGVDGWVEAFAENGKMVGGGPILEGHEAIREAMGVLSRPGYSLAWEPKFAEVSASGDLGYTHGTYRREVKREDGETAVETGKYVSIWRRDASGKFRVALDIGNPDPPESR